MIEISIVQASAVEPRSMIFAQTIMRLFGEANVALRMIYSTIRCGALNRQKNKERILNKCMIPPNAQLVKTLAPIEVAVVSAISKVVPRATH